jgi:hypothetical protein
MRPLTAPGRWIWGLSGLVTAVALAIPGARLITWAGVPSHWPATPGYVTRTITVPQPVTRLDVGSYGAPVTVTAGPVRRVRVIETIAYSPRDAGPPAVTQSVSGGRLTLADPACDVADCTVSFTVTVPPDVAVTAATGGGLLHLSGLAGPLYADTGGGPLVTDNIAAATATIITDGGRAQIRFAEPPDSVFVSTSGGLATLVVPGGPYALHADSDGGPMFVLIATDPAARRSITVATGGGPLHIKPTADRASAGS